MVQEMTEGKTIPWVQHSLLLSCFAKPKPTIHSLVSLVATFTINQLWNCDRGASLMRRRFPGSPPEGPTQLDDQLIVDRTQRRPILAGDRVSPAVVPDDKEIVAWFDGPAEASVGAQIARLGIVLDVARKDQIRTQGVDRLELQKVECEIPLGETPGIVLAIEFELKMACRSRVGHESRSLSQRTGVEVSEPHRGPHPPRTMAGGLGLDPKARIGVFPWRDDDTFGDFELLVEAFELRHDVGFEVFARLGMGVERRGEDPPGFCPPIGAFDVERKNVLNFFNSGGDPVQRSFGLPAPGVRLCPLDYAVTQLSRE